MTPVINDPIDVDPKPIDETLARRSPEIPVTLNEIAALKSGAIEVIEARVQVIETLRKASIRATSPEDWLLFKAPDEQGGQVVGYLQDCGADRVRDLWGIEIFDVSKPERIVGNDPAVFHYIVEGSGRCKLTRQILEQVEGGRSSTDDFCKGKTGAELELLVRKAARANLDGNITRELAGMKSVPLDDLEAAWGGTKKLVAHCRRGRGFGTRDERVGGRTEKAPDVDPPVCTHCGAKGVYRPAKGDRKAFYGCPNYEKHRDKTFIVDAEKWVKDHEPAPAATTTEISAAAAPPAAQAQTTRRATTQPPMTAGQIPFGGREPGDE